VTYFNIELERHPYSDYPMLIDLEGYTQIKAISGALVFGYSWSYIRFGLGESEGSDWQAGIDASMDYFCGYSYLEKNKKECCY